MKKGLFICSLLVVVQLVVTMLVYQRAWQEDRTVQTGPLLTMEVATVQVLELEDRDGRSLVVQQELGGWFLPALAGLPADGPRIQRLLERIGTIQRGWPEATTAEAALRFRVADDQFERKLTLHGKDGTREVWYFGVSSGLRRLYFRVDGDQEIYSLQVPAHELEVLADAWIDASLLHIEADQVERVELPGLTLVRDAAGLQPNDLGRQEDVIRERLDTFVGHLTGLSVTGVLGSERKAGFDLDDSFFSYRLVLADGSVQDYAFFRPVTDELQQEEAILVDNSPVLQVSGYEQLFRAAVWQVEDIAGISRDDLVRPQGEENALPAIEALDPFVQ
jgi:hypothetical protein